MIAREHVPKQVAVWLTMYHSVNVNTSWYRVETWAIHNAGTVLVAMPAHQKAMGQCQKFLKICKISNNGARSHLMCIMQ